MKNRSPLVDPLLPPKALTISLPAISVDEAEILLQLVDELHHLLWDAYGEAVTDQWVEDHAVDDSGATAIGDDDLPDF